MTSIAIARPIVTAADLDAVRDEYAERTRGLDFTIMVCTGAGCLSSQAGEIAAALDRELAAAGLAERTLVKHTGCIGACGLGPAVIVEPDGIFYGRLTPGDVHDTSPATMRACFITPLSSIHSNQPAPPPISSAIQASKASRSSTL